LALPQLRARRLALQRRDGAELFVEQRTVKTHLVRLYSKLGVDSRAQAVARARALGLLDGHLRGFHPASPPSGGRAPLATPPS
jgi:hypothetical protein